MKDSIKINGTVRIDKYDALTMEPNAEPVIFENTVLLTGWTELLKLITGASANHFDATYATIGVGDDATGAAEGQTDLIAATNKTYKAMSSGYPTSPSSQTIQFKSVFLATEANYHWQEYVIKNSTSAICLSRGASDLGTKTNADIWAITWTWGK